MASPLLARTVKVVIKAHRGIDQRCNVLHLQTVASGVTDVEVQNAVTHVFNWINAYYKEFVSSLIQFDSVDGQAIDVANGYQYSTSFTNVFGAITPGPYMPGNACMVATLHTAQGGRSGRGRMFLFEREAAAISDGELFVPAVVAQAQTAVNALWNPTTPPPNLVLAVGSPKGLCSFPVTSVVCHSYVASQRDRLPGHRAHHKRHIP